MLTATRVAPVQVLLVEDDEPSAILATEALSRMNCAVTRAIAGDVAVELAADQVFDLVFMDFHLPRMNGLEATQRIRAAERLHGRRIPIVGLAASAMPEERAQCLQAGMDDVLLKPFMLDALRAMVAQWAT